MTRPPPRRSLLIFLALLAKASQSQPAPPPRVLRIGGSVIEPFVMGGINEPVRGAVPDFIKQEIAPRMSVQFEWQQATTHARALKGLQDGSLDIVLFHANRLDKLEGIGRFDFIYYETQPCLVVSERSPLRAIHAVSELAGLEIAWPAGALLPRELDVVPIKWQLISAQNWQAVVLRMVNAGRVDAAVFGNPISPAYVAGREKLVLRLLPLPTTRLQFVMLYSLKANKALIAEFGRLAKQAFKGDKFRLMLDSYAD